MSGRLWMKPTVVAGRTVVAQTCMRCHRLLTGDKFSSGRHADGRRVTRTVCRSCNVKRVAEWRRSNPEKLRAMLARQGKRRNAKSLDGAANHGKQWTGPELEMALRDDLSLPELAKMLGRTVAAVAAQRRLASGGHPMKVHVAGAARRAGDSS